MKLRIVPRLLLALGSSAGLFASPALPQQQEGDTAFLRSRGYGWVAAVAAGQVGLFQETASSLLPLIEGFVEDDLLYLPLDEDEEGNPLFVPFASIREEEDTVVLEVRDHTVIRFDVIDELPHRTITGPTDDPVTVFQVFWEILNENSSYLALTGIDWQAVYDDYRPRVSADTTEDELFDMLAAMAAPLRDGHLVLVASSLERVFAGRPPSDSVWMLERAGEAAAVVGTYLDAGSIGITGNDRIVFGTIDDSIGYLAILGFQGYSGTADPLADQAVFETALDEAMTEISEADALIVDLRINLGGHDNLPLALAGRFTDRRRLGFAKQARVGGVDEFAEPTEVFFGPRGIQFLDRPVRVLVSNNTVSAADLQAMVLKGLPNVRLVGETTAGAFSNALRAVLPNSWELTLSNERYLSRERPPRDYELTGVAPDVPVPGSQEALDQGRDNILERALEDFGPTRDCQAGPTRLCLNDGRFAVEVAWSDFQGQTGSAQVVPFGSDDSGLLWFFSPDNWELLVKVLDGCSINDRFWVFSAATTNVEYTLRVTDSETRTVREYFNPLGDAAAAVTDTSAFATCP